MKQKRQYPEPKRAKVGRSLFVCDFDGKPLVGLSWDKANGQYYYTYYYKEQDVIKKRKNRKDYSFGSDYADAVFEFKQWVRDNNKFSLTLENAQTDKMVILPTDNNNYEIHNLLSTHKDKITTDKQYALHLLKQLLNDEEIRIEAIRHLKLDDLLPTEYKTLPIMTVYQFYKDANPCSDKEKRQVKTAVEHFINITKKKNVNDISEDDLELFRDVIKGSNKSDTYIAGRLNRVKTVLNYYLENKSMNGEKELVRTVLTKAKEILKFKTPDPDESPKSFDLKTLKKIFQRAKKNSELTLMYLLMLNTGFYPVDIRQLKKTMIREKDGLTYIVHRRTKTKQTYIRVNCLWSITADLLKKQCDKHPNSQYVFITDSKGAYAESTLGKRFTEFFKALTKQDKPSISAKNFRDTVASNLAFDVVNVNVLKVTLGHSIKSSKDEFWKYIENRPDQQKPAIDVLYDKFMTVIESIN